MAHFAKLQKAIKDYDEGREALIVQSRVVLKLSKQLIYAVHRDDLKSAASLLKNIEEEKKKLDEIASREKGLDFEGSYKVAIQEYVEAVLYLHFVKSGKLVDLDVHPVYFVLGLADLPGELVRRAVFLAGKGEIAAVVKIRDEVDAIYGEMLNCEFRDNEVRRKVDAIKYDLRKLEDLVLDLKLKGRGV